MYTIDKLLERREVARQVQYRVRWRHNGGQQWVPAHLLLSLLKADPAEMNRTLINVAVQTQATQTLSAISEVDFTVFQVSMPQSTKINLSNCLQALKFVCKNWKDSTKVKQCLE